MSTFCFLTLLGRQLMMRVCSDIVRPVTLAAAFLVCVLGGSAAWGGAIDHVPEAAGYTVAYELPIPLTANFRNANAVPYSLNKSASVGPYDRIAYYMELKTPTGALEYVYASMDSFNNNAAQIGLPHNVNNPVIHQQIVSNMNVFSNKAGVTMGTGIATGNIEMWSTNYGGGTTGLIPTGTGAFDWNDSGAGIGAGHGSFQVHNHGGTGEVLFAYNDWGGNNAAGSSELGIGTNPGGNPDWTFQDSTHLYEVKNLQVLVRELTPPVLPSAPAHIVANAPEAGQYKLVYQLPVTSSAFNPGQYVVNNSAQIPDGSYDRIGYYLELDSQWVWVSADAFNADASFIGVPNTDAHIQQMLIDNMNVVSNVSGVVNGTGIATGNIEFWNTNYGGGTTGLVPGGTGSFDYNDTLSTGGNYGSMQIHNHGIGAQQTLLAYNRWGSDTGELGIGNQPTGSPDWTFAGNSGAYAVKNLYVMVRPNPTDPPAVIPEPVTLGLLGLALTGLGNYVRRRRID